MDTCRDFWRSPYIVCVPLHGQNKARLHNLLCFDLYDLSRRSSGLVSRPLCDLSLSPCITRRKACWPIRPLWNVSGNTAQWRYHHEKRILYKNMFFTISSPHTAFKKIRVNFILSWSTIILLSYLYCFFFFYWNTFSLKRACSTGSPVYKVSIKNTKQMNMKFEETEQIVF